MSDRTCSVQGCGKAHAAKGFCGAHYAKWRKYGDPSIHIGSGRPAVKRPCGVVGCPKDAATRGGLCRKHNRLRLDYGRPEVTVEGTLERFEKFVAKSKSGCWEWTGGRLGSRSQYGQFSMKSLGRPVVLAHRMAWELYRGPIPEGLTIDHLCRNTICVNPDHLEPVTQAENNRRGLAARGGKRACRAAVALQAQGFHPLESEARV